MTHQLRLHLVKWILCWGDTQLDIDITFFIDLTNIWKLMNNKLSVYSSLSDFISSSHLHILKTDTHVTALAYN